MSEYCENCGTEISDGGFVKSPNLKIPKENLELINFINETTLEEMCQKCGEPTFRDVVQRINTKIEKHQDFIKNNSTYFPMMTIQTLPNIAKYKIKTLVTSNVAVGTGFFSEFSQGFSDIFGAVNTDTGMAYKVNNGEAVARALLASKAIRIGANCVIGVDIDYGTTANNAATINMQGTAVEISNLSDILDKVEFDMATSFSDAHSQMAIAIGWLNGDLRTLPT